MLECLVQWDHDRAIARQIWPGSPPALSSLPTEQNITKDEAAEVVERFRTAMCMLPGGVAMPVGLSGRGHAVGSAEDDFPTRQTGLGLGDGYRPGLNFL